MVDPDRSAIAPQLAGQIVLKVLDEYRDPPFVRTFQWYVIYVRVAYENIVTKPCDVSFEGISLVHSLKPGWRIKSKEEMFAEGWAGHPLQYS
jgi:hypothetical protein